MLMFMIHTVIDELPHGEEKSVYSDKVMSLVITRTSHWACYVPSDINIDPMVFPLSKSSNFISLSRLIETFPY